MRMYDTCIVATGQPSFLIFFKKKALKTKVERQSREWVRRSRISLSSNLLPRNLYEFCSDSLKKSRNKQMGRDFHISCIANAIG